MALDPAVLGYARLGNFRLGYVPAALTAVRQTRVSILLDGVQARTRVRVGSLTVHDALNESANTAALTIDGTAPEVSQALRVSVNSDTPRLLFNGALQTVELSYEGLPSQWAWPSTAIDDLAQLNRRRPFGTFTNVSATTVAQTLITQFAPGFTSVWVAAGLPPVSVNFDGSEGFSGCLAQLAKLIGGYYYVEDRDLHLFQTEATDTPDPIEVGYPFLDDPPITYRSDDSQLRTRVYGKGHGEPTVSAVAAGETIVPIAQATMFNASGGQAISETEIFAYTGVQSGGAGSLVGFGVQPSVALQSYHQTGAGVEDGVHQYAYTWKTAAGETIPSPLSVAITMGTVAAPTTGPDSATTGGPIVGGPPAGTLRYTLTIANIFDTGETTMSPIRSWVAPGNKIGNVTWTPTAAMVGYQCCIYRSEDFGATNWRLNQAYVSAAIVGVAQVFYDINPHMTSGTAPPGTSTAIFNRAIITGVALGPTGTTDRKIYRTAAGGSQLKLQQTIANNTSVTGVDDSTPDASLGANAPTTDTSGLSTVAGQVSAGSTSLLMASAGPFSATGGWVRVGLQLVRYTGLTGNTLTGIPASGLGALLNSVTYGEHVDVAAALTGVTGLSIPLALGAPVNIWVQRDDLVAQAEAAARESTPTHTSDGVHEHRISDERRGEASLTALCEAELALFARPIVTVTYATRDTKTRSGKPIVINLTSPPITETLTIQDVAISEIDVAPYLAPRFSVTASNVRFSLDDLLRQLKAGSV